MLVNRTTKKVKKVKTVKMVKTVNYGKKKILGGGEIFRTCPDPAFFKMGTGSFLGVESGRSVVLTPHPL
jgi:hypothetical protein